MCVCACSVLQLALCKDTIVISFYGNICIILITEEALGSLKSAVKKLHLLKFTFPLSRSLSLTFSTLFPPCPFRLPDESEGRQPSRERRDGERYFYHSIVCSSHLKRVTFFSRKRTRLHIQHGNARIHRHFTSCRKLRSTNHSDAHSAAKKTIS